MKVNFRNIKVGDEVVRWLGGEGGIPMTLKVTELDDDFIHCGPWKFSRTLGYEIDEDTGWGIPDGNGMIASGSFLKRLDDTD